jgi:meso-butanediol dehydrogenase/(S,S)-butanediol dehydrogenase/diacetyl reductase
MAGRAALVTGGGGGIGEATGRLFAEEGAAVALVDTDARAVEAAAAGIAVAAAGATVVPLVADLAREPEAERAVSEAVARIGALHTLVNVAGARVYQPLAGATPEDWDFILGVNVLATAFCCKAAVRHLRASGRGTIVNVSSVYGVLGRAGMGQYDTTKAAVLGFTRALAVEEAPHGIRVNAVCPGSTITPYHIRRAASQGIAETELRRQRGETNLLGRWAEPHEVAFPILFLASDESSYITGATLMVDAGKSIL